MKNVVKPSVTITLRNGCLLGAFLVALFFLHSPSLAVVEGQLPHAGGVCVPDGYAVKLPNFAAIFTGRPYDNLSVHVAGAVVIKRRSVELAGVMRGPFTDNPTTSYAVWAFDRGAGRSLALISSVRPNLFCDAIVEVTVQGYGSSVSGVIIDRVTGNSVGIDPGRISVQGSVVRVWLSPSQLPSKGRKINDYTFGFFMKDSEAFDPTHIASYIPEDSMIKIGVSR